jgi:hypothetical protein
MNLDALPAKEQISFLGGNVDGYDCDSGGQLYSYFKNHPQVKVKILKAFRVRDLQDMEPEIETRLRIDYDNNYAFEVFEDFMFHSRIGSNWANIPAGELAKRNRIIRALLDRYLS